MPRVMPPPKVQKDRDVLALIAFYQNKYGISDATIIKSLGITANTYRSRKKDTGTFSLREWRILVKILNIPKEDAVTVL